MNTQIQATASDRMPQDTNETRPYAPSFIDRFMDWVERMPVPYGVIYLTLFVLEGALNHVLSWIDGWLSVYAFSPLILMYPLWPWGPLAIMTYLNSISRKALADFRPLLDVPSETVERLEYEFTTMPQKGVIFSTLIWAIWYLVISYPILDALHRYYGWGTFVITVVFLQGLITFLIGSVIYHHSIRQLRLVDKTVKLVKQFNLFQLDPVYAFSVLTSRTGIAWALLLSFTLLAFPIEIALLPTLTIMGIQILLVTAAFALPLLSVNQRLVTEKRRLLAEHSQRLQSTLVRMHDYLNQNKLSEMVELNNAITGLKAEGEILEKIPTWPWRAGLLPGFMSIVVLPIMLFLVQLVLGRWLAR